MAGLSTGAWIGICLAPIALVAGGALLFLSRAPAGGQAAPVAAETSATATATALAASASATAPEPLWKKSNRVMKAKAVKLGLGKPTFELLPFDILTAYTTNELKAEKDYGKGVAFGGIMLSVAREEGQVAVVVRDGRTETQDAQIAFKLRHVRMVLDQADGTSVDVATEVTAGEVLFAVCSGSNGIDHRYVTFTGCSIWSGKGGPGASASASASASATP